MVFQFNIFHFVFSPFFWYFSVSKFSEDPISEDSLLCSRKYKTKASPNQNSNFKINEPLSLQLNSDQNIKIFLKLAAKKLEFCMFKNHQLEQSNKNLSKNNRKYHQNDL